MQGTQEKVKNGKQGTVLCKEEKNNSKKYTEKGITLIALVVTIIILLILAGITINMLLGENGIIRTAQEAKNTWENAIINDQENLNSLIAELDEILTDKSKDIYVYLYDDGTLAFSNASEPIEGKTVVKEYGNIKGQEYKSWADEDNNIVSDTPWFNETSLITKVSIIDEIVPTSMSSWFDSCINLTEFENIEKIDTSEVKSMSGMFDTCSSLATLDLSSFDTSNVTNMNGMFNHCDNLIEIIGLEKFDTSNVIDMEIMFANCGSLTNLNLNNFNTSNVESMKAMFAGISLTNLDLSNFDTSSVKSMNGMFDHCINLTEITGLEKFDTSNVTDMRAMFYECNNLQNLNLSSFNTSKVTNMGDMFFNCRTLTSLDVSTFDTSRVSDMNHIFAGCENLTVIYVGDNWDLTNVENTSNMFANCGVNTTTPKPSN
ncbi:MAG: BspA family leucine-rich repeat surface protein [Intestinibacter sp.]